MTGTSQVAGPGTCMSRLTVLLNLQVLESPNDSYPWIRFMAFHVELGEVAKARAVAERALQTINYRQTDAVQCAHEQN